MERVFINAEGKFLKFTSTPHWSYVWVASIHHASVASSLPVKKRWVGQDNPAKYVAISVPVEVVITRKVTIVKIKDEN